MILKSLLKDKFIYFSIAIVIFAIYANSLRNEFVSDDKAGILLNPRISDWDYIFRSYIGWGHSLVLYTLVNVFGKHAWIFRTYNILMHIGFVSAIFYLFRHLYNRKLGLLVAFLFAVHPILTESITWIAGSSYVSSGFFFLLSFILFIETEDKYDWRYFLSLFLYLFAVLTSEKAVSLAAVFILYRFIYSKECKASFLKAASYLSIAGVFAILLATTLGKRTELLAKEYYQESGFVNPLYQIPIAIAQYFKLYVWPQALTLYHSETYFTYSEYIVHLIVFLLAFIPALFSLIKSRGGVKNALLFWKNVEVDSKNPSRMHDYKFVAFWFFFFIIAMLPTLTPFKVSWLVAERYAYIGTLGIFAIVAYGVYKLMNFEQFKIAIVGVFVCILIALGIRTIYRNLDWYNEDTLWFATVKYSPSSPNIYNNLGDVYSRRGDYFKAAENFKYATVIKPNYADAYHNLAYTYQIIAVDQTAQEERQKYLDLAEQNYLEAIKYNPYLWQSMQNLALIYFDEGKLEQGYQEYSKAIQLNPANPGLYVTYIQVNLNLKNYEEAEKAAQILLNADPANPQFQSIMNQVQAAKSGASQPK